MSALRAERGAVRPPDAWTFLSSDDAMRHRPFRLLGRLSTIFAMALTLLPASPISTAAALTVLPTSLALLAPPATRLAAQAPAPPPDSADLVKEMREKQKNFERFRQSRIPVHRERTAQSCDHMIGRMCIWFGGEVEADFPAELADVAPARNFLVQELGRVAELIRDPWVWGQLVHYLEESGRAREAERVARDCDLTEAWWCSALLGYVQHLGGRHVEAEASFRQALETMPEDERERWLTPRYVLSDDVDRRFRRADAADPEAGWGTLWRYSDPLFLVDGNDRLTDHLARWVEATNRRDAENPQGYWDDDLEETLIRYGRILGWSRSHAPERTLQGRGAFRLQDTRRTIGHHHPMSRGYLFPEEFLEAPADIPPESWVTPPREARTWYAPPYAPDFRGLDTQVGRFWRGQDLLVVGAYRPAPADTSTGAQAGAAASDAEPTGPVQAALFLVPEDGSPPVKTESSDARGVFTVLAPPGRYVSSIEVWQPEGRRAWRARQGVQQVPVLPGAAAVSDMLILRPGAPFPETLEEALPDVRPGIRVARDERFTVVWEVYGFETEGPARVTFGFTRGRPGFLARVGEFLGIIEPGAPVEVSFEDASLDGVGFAFRAVTLELPELDPGPYTLHLRLELPGQEPVTTSRPIVVTAG